MAEGNKKSLDQLIELAMSVYYNWDITNREKNKRHDLIAGPTRLLPVSWTCYHGGQEGHFCRECLKGDSLGDSPAPNSDPALSARVTSGGLSAPVSVSRWIDGSQPSAHTPLLGINVEEPRGSHYDKKTKDHFLPNSGAHFSVLFFSPSPQSNDKVIIQDKSGQHLELKFTWPLACSWEELLFCHSFLIVPKTPMSLLGWDLLSQQKPQILLPPGSYFCCPLLQKQIDPTM
jgi:hypothetical protein